MVPGITSFSAVAAQLGWSLTEENAPLHIIPGSTDLQAALHLPGTKVLMKSGSAIGDTVAALEKAGLLDRAALVCDCGLPRRKFIATFGICRMISAILQPSSCGRCDLMQASVPGWFLPERTAAAAKRPSPAPFCRRL